MLEPTLIEQHMDRMNPGKVEIDQVLHKSRHLDNVGPVELVRFLCKIPMKLFDCLVDSSICVR